MVEHKVAPVFETKVKRTVLPVHSNGSQVEVAIDRGQIQAAGASEDVSEVELELKSGKCEALVEVARMLAAEFPLQYWAKSKAERGYALSEHDKHERSEATGTEPIFLDEQATVGEGFRQIGQACLRHISLNEAAVIELDAEAVHQTRVGVRERIASNLLEDLKPNEAFDREAAYAIGLVRGQENSTAHQVLAATKRAGARLSRLPRFPSLAQK